MFDFEVTATTKYDEQQFLHDFIYDALRHEVPFLQFKKRKKYSRRSVTFSKAAGFSLQLY